MARKKWVFWRESPRVGRSLILANKSIKETENLFFSVRFNFISLMNTKTCIFTRGYRHSWKYCFWCPLDEIKFDLTLKKKTTKETHNKWATSWQNQQCGCAPSQDSDQPGHPPSLIRVFAVRMKKPWVLSYLLSAQRRLWSDWADAQADLSLRWAHSHIVGFVMRRLKYSL